jgi:hypothetical protein
VRRHPDIPRRTFDAWALKLTNLRQHVEDMISGLADNRVSVRDVVDAIVDQIEEDGIVNIEM